mmetsp:Transcript_36947/g.110683  ORF Transcript_36947/g.110683 Transcript_36947/m.110683 type:complete len:92 (+) Transcript_36947:989-1264(+)
MVELVDVTSAEGLAIRHGRGRTSQLVDSFDQGKPEEYPFLGTCEACFVAHDGNPYGAAATVQFEETVLHRGTCQTLLKVERDFHDVQSCNH